jgi:regulator of protease activity HflC (stomatin/prohibitin superfamily)
MDEVKIIKRVAFGAVAGVTGIMVLWGSWYTVDQGQRGVLLRNGAVIGTAEPGLGFKVPLIDGVRRISVQAKAREYEAVAAYSKDQQTAVMRLSVSYSLPPDEVTTIYSEYGGEEGIVSRLLDRQVSKSLEEVFGRFNAVTAIQERARLGRELQSAIQEAVVGPIIISGVQIENIDFSDAYETSIEQRMLAEVEVQKVQQNAAREKVQAEIAVIQAQASADARVAQAKAEAEATRLAGNAEADAIRARASALADNPALIALVQAERWDGRLPTTMLPDSTVPFMQMARPEATP